MIAKGKKGKRGVQLLERGGSGQNRASHDRGRERLMLFSGATE